MNPNSVTLNDEQKSYTIKDPSGGYSCFGYQNCFDHVKKLADILGHQQPDPLEMGTLALYRRYQDLITLYAQHPASKETYFEPGTNAEVQKIIEDARERGTRLRWFYGNRETGQSWLEESDVEGTIGRSMGPLREPLGICDDEPGGPALLTSSIIRLVDARTKNILYSHPNFHLPNITFTYNPEVAAYPLQANVEGSRHANFASVKEAEKWVMKITGVRAGATPESLISLRRLQNELPEGWEKTAKEAASISSIEREIEENKQKEASLKMDTDKLEEKLAKLKALQQEKAKDGPSTPGV